MPKASSGAAPLTVLVLAAGLGRRMRSKTIKLLHPVWGRPMIDFVLDAVAALAPARTLVVLGHQADRMRAALDGRGVEFVVQEEQLGTGHAVRVARPALESAPGDILILNGDLPLLRPSTLADFRSAHQASGAALSLLTARLPDPSGYGRVVRRPPAIGAVVRIVEHRDATPDELLLDEINCGVYLAARDALLPALDRLSPANAQGEYYLTDVAADLAEAGLPVAAVPHADAREVLGVNSRAELAAAAALLGARKNEELMDEGVTLLDPDRTFIDPRARVGRDTIVYPGVWIEGESVIGEDCVIGPGAHLIGARLGHRVEIKDGCRIEASEIGDAAQIGPFAHLRPGNYLSERVKIGNFVELKKATLGPGSKANHLTYLGDAEIGRDVNVGAGTITCNYDGRTKSRTVLEDGVFVGSDTQLVAPVRVGAGAYIGAGTTVTEDVPAGALAVSRAPQKNIAGWAARRAARRKG